MVLYMLHDYRMFDDKSIRMWPKVSFHATSKSYIHIFSIRDFNDLDSEDSSDELQDT